MIVEIALLGAVSAGLSTPAPADRQNIGLSTAILQKVGDALWPGWSKTTFQIDLLTARGPVLINVDKAFTPPPFPNNLEATLFLETGPTIVIGQPQFTQANTPIRWSITLLHEHFHQWQDSWPKYTSATASLNLARGDKTGMWMLNYNFPYADAKVDDAFALMTNRLADALGTIGAAEFGDSVHAYVDARNAFKALLSSDDYRYFAFQCWQEGVARYTEITVARMAAQAHLANPAFLSDAQAVAIRQDADATYAAVVKRLRTIPLARDQRVDFYAVGAGEALLLDQLSPNWRKQYLDPQMDLGRFFNTAIRPGRFATGSLSAPRAGAAFLPEQRERLDSVSARILA